MYQAQHHRLLGRRQPPPFLQCYKTPYQHLDVEASSIHAKREPHHHAPLFPSSFSFCPCVRVNAFPGSRTVPFSYDDQLLMNPFSLLSFYHRRAIGPHQSWAANCTTRCVGRAAVLSNRRFSSQRLPGQFFSWSQQRCVHLTGPSHQSMPIDRPEEPSVSEYAPTAGKAREDPTAVVEMDRTPLHLKEKETSIDDVLCGEMRGKKKEKSNVLDRVDNRVDLGASETQDYWKDEQDRDQDRQSSRRKSSRGIKLLMFAALQIVPLSVGIGWLILYSKRRVDEEFRYQQILELGTTKTIEEEKSEREKRSDDRRRKRQHQLLMDEVRIINGDRLTRRLLVVPSTATSLEVTHLFKGPGQPSFHDDPLPSTSRMTHSPSGLSPSNRLSSLKRRISGVIKQTTEALDPKLQPHLVVNGQSCIILQLPRSWDVSPVTPSIQYHASYFLIHPTRRPLIELVGNVQGLEGDHSKGFTMQFLPSTLICSIHGKGSYDSGAVVVDLKEQRSKDAISIQEE